MTAQLFGFYPALKPFEDPQQIVIHSLNFKLITFNIVSLFQPQSQHKIGRLSDGIVFCQLTQSHESQLQSAKLKLKQYHKDVTSFLKRSTLPLKQIEHHSFSIYFRVIDYTVFTMVAVSSYPGKLAGSFLEGVANGFLEEVKCAFGAQNYQSRLESVETPHYFAKYDRLIKAKKKQYEDPSSIKNVERMKRQLDNIHEIVKENMSTLDKRRQDLEETEEKARLLNDQSRKFADTTKKLVWSMWLRKYALWIGLVLFGVVLYWLI